MRRRVIAVRLTTTDFDKLSLSNMQNRGRLKAKQKGAVVILIAFIVGLGVLAYLLNAYDPARLRLAQDKKTMQALNEAKQALIAWAVSHPDYPGQMPLPDRNGEATPNYDGFSDCPPSGTPFSEPSSYALLIGQLPIYGQGVPCVSPLIGLGGNYYDGQGNRLWYAVSRNLVHRYEFLSANPSSNPIINPSIINNSIWLKVRDENGNIISDRVAAVITSPGAAIGSQNRTGAANVNNYLDTFLIGATAFSNSDYDSSDEDFVIRKDRDVNDKLVYITIDELMAALEKRVGEAARMALKNYQDTNGYYPYAAHLGTSLSYDGDGDLQSGFLPIFQNCSYIATSVTNRALNCTQPIFDAVTSGITTVRFYLPSGIFTSSAGSCTGQTGNTQCHCSGAGSCSTASLTFSCNTTTCNAVGTGATGDMRIVDGKLAFATGGCVINTPIAQDGFGCPISNTNTTIRVTCNSDGTAASFSNTDVALDSFLPAWFKANQWQNFVYYQMTRPAAASLTVDTHSTEAVIVTVGRPINTAPFALSKGAEQLRPSCNMLNDYLDSVENADSDGMYDATSLQRNASYNDQTFVVVP
jgi:hypothetical protein